MNEYLNEQEQWELVKTWLRENLPGLVAGVALAVAGVFAWRWYQARQTTQALQAHERYEAVVTSYERGDLPSGEKLADAMRADFPGSGYSVQADLLTASAELQNKQSAQAAVRLARVMNDSSDPGLSLIARLRLARVQIDMGQSDTALQTLNVADPGSFTARIAEVRGDALLAKGDRKGALQAYQSARASGDTAIDTDTLDLKINELEQS